MVAHPGFLLGRERDQAIAAVVEQLGELRGRLEPKGRAVPFGVEITGRARELGSLGDVLAIASQLSPAQPVLDFAHLHAVSAGGFRGADAFAEVLAAADAVLEPGGRSTFTSRGESPDDASNQAIRAALFGEPAPVVPAASGRLF